MNTAYPQCQKKCRLVKVLLVIVLLLITLNSIGQATWTGMAGDGQWINPANWTGSQLPSAAADVILDNSAVSGSYTVSLPADGPGIIVKSITISPVTGSHIQLLLPAADTATPALTVTGPGYGVVIDNGGLLLNSSSISGPAMVVKDSIRINNGGQYTHNSRSSHAALVTVLSRMPGTEKGIFKFDVPGGGYTLASTHRVYGTLVFSADASDGSQVYGTTASSPLLINGDLVIQAGVTVNLSTTAATTIKGNYRQSGGIFNLASKANNNTIYVQGDLLQLAGVVTETSTGLPSIELNGSSQQHIQIAGTITNNVGLRINNSAGVTMQTGLALPYKLSLLKGILHTGSFGLTLLAGCGIQADSTGNNSFVDGPLRKEGLTAASHFLFPVGKGTVQRWLTLQQATGNYTVEFFPSNPAVLTAATGAGIHHISTGEYWAMATEANPVPAAAIELSFNNVNSGGVTDLSALRVAQLLSGVWTNKGNTATTGTAGSAGSVTSTALNVFDPAVNYFTLASSDSFQNPLPVKLISFTAAKGTDEVQLNWILDPSWQPDKFELQSAADGIHFTLLYTMPSVINQGIYHYKDKYAFTGRRYYRLKAIDQDGSVFYSNIASIENDNRSNLTVQARPSVVKSMANIYVNAAVSGYASIVIAGADGKILQVIKTMLHPGSNAIQFSVQTAAPGMYALKIQMADGNIAGTRFIKVN